MTANNNEQKEEFFTHEFLIALSNWQNGWYENQERRRIIADELVLLCEKLPLKFKTVSHPCYRKRFIVSGELVPILLQDEFFEGIASWTKDLEYAKNFKGIIKQDVKHVMVFKHFPLPEEIVVNIISLWKDDAFNRAVKQFTEYNNESAKALLHFRDHQSEIVLRSTLKGSEIENMVGVSSSFQELCDMAGIPEEKRKELSIRYEKDPNGIAIEIPIFGGMRSTKKAIQQTLLAFEEKVKENVHFDYSNAAVPHKDDLKHKPIYRK